MLVIQLGNIFPADYFFPYEFPTVRYLLKNYFLSAKSKITQGHKSLPVVTSTGSPWVQNRWTPPRSPRGQLLRQTPFQAPDIRAPSLPEERCPPGPGGYCQSICWRHLGSWILPRLVCTGSRHPGTFPARGEVSTPPGRAFLQHLGEPSWFPDPTTTSLCR